MEKRGISHDQREPLGINSFALLGKYGAGIYSAKLEFSVMLNYEEVSGEKKGLYAQSWTSLSI